MGFKAVLAGLQRFTNLLRNAPSPCCRHYTGLASCCCVNDGKGQCSSWIGSFNTDQEKCQSFSIEALVITLGLQAKWNYCRAIVQGVYHLTKLSHF